MGSLSVAHEIGRLRHKEYIEIQVDIYDKLKRLGLMEEVDISEYIKMCLDIYRLDIELEKEGQKKGRQIAVDIGIDPFIYGEYERANLRTYCYRGLEDLKNRLPSEASVGDGNIEIYAPESGDIISFKYHELIKWLDSIELETKIYETYSSLEELETRLRAIL